MTPPPISSWMHGRTPLHEPPPFLPTASSTVSLDSDIVERTIPLLDSPTFTDTLDILDTMMSATHPHPHTSHKHWNDSKAVVISAKHVMQHLKHTAFAIDDEHAISIAQALIRVNGLIPTFKVQSSGKTFISTPSATYVHRGLTCLSAYGLNTIVAYPGPPRPMLDVLLDLNSVFQQICFFSVSIGGQYVDYTTIRGSVGWRRALSLLAELAQCDDSHFDRVDDSTKKACFFNLYNLLIIHAKLVFGHPSDLLKRGKFFNDAAYLIAGKRITSVELEHEVLRRRMRTDDDRISWRLQKLEPRMHFILNCGAQSCPPLQPVGVDDVEMVLDHAAKDFIDTEVKVDLIKNRVTLSRLWKWFRKDFTPMSDKNDDLLTWIINRAGKAMQARLNILMEKDYKLDFDVYNWADNGDVNAKPDTRFMAIYDLSFARTA